MEEILLRISVMALPILLAITLHEAAHGYVANYFGDPTAKRLGRLSLNPIKHIDPFGTIILPAALFFIGGFIFGYAKPVPVTAENLRNPKSDMVWVALAGPAANIFLAFMGGVLLLLLPIIPGAAHDWFANNLTFLIFFNFLIALFNMLPLPPLDGGRVVAGLLPGPLAYKFNQIERYGFIILLGLIFLLPMLFSSLGIRFNLLQVLIFDPAYWLTDFILNLFG
ncbi:MAG: site-2 protease family protein [Sphingomonadales bacterium]